MNSNSTVVIKIPSMHVESNTNYLDDILNASFSCINTARTNNYKNLIIDVRDNGEGNVDFAYYLSQLFVPMWRSNSTFIQPYDISVTNYFNSYQIL